MDLIGMRHQVAISANEGEKVALAPFLEPRRQEIVSRLMSLD